jgi:hypothetical protein
VYLPHPTSLPSPGANAITSTASDERAVYGTQEDNIFRVFGGDRIKGMMGAFGIDDVPLESNMLSKSLNEAQKKVELPFLLIYISA